MTPADSRRLAIALGPIKDLSLSGGEPLLRKDLEDFLEPVLRICKPRSVTFPTGGLHPELVENAARIILSHAPSARLTMALSFDGPAEVHDDIRGIHGAYRKLKRTYEILAPLSESGILNIKLVSTLNNLNEGFLEEMFQSAGEDFPAASFHHLEMMRGKSRDASVRPPNPDILLKNRTLIIEHWRKYDGFFAKGALNRLALAAKIRLHDLSVDWLHGVDNMPPCRVDKTHLVVFETGDVAFCELTDPIGNIREMDLSAILKSSEARKRKAMIRAGCSCVHSCFTPSNLVRSPVEWPRVFRMSTKLC